MSDNIFVDFSSLPPEEHAYARQITGNLLTLDVNARDFRYTAESYFHTRLVHKSSASDSWRKMAWVKMAGRHGSLVAASIIEVTKDINGTRAKAPEIWRRADAELKKIADKLLTDHFSNIHGVRTISAHPGELHSTEQGRQTHSLKTMSMSPGILSVFGAGSSISDSMSALDDNLVFSGSFKGQFSSYELSYESADILDEVVALYYATFYGLEASDDFVRRKQDFARDLLHPRG